MGTNGRGARDAIIALAGQNFLFKLWGKVTNAQDEFFWLDDGSGNPVCVAAGGEFTCANGDYVSVRGSLYMRFDFLELTAQETQVLKAD